MEVIEHKERVVQNPQLFLRACERVLDEHDVLDVHSTIDCYQVEYIVEALALIMRVHFPRNLPITKKVLNIYCGARESIDESPQAEEFAMTSALWAMKRYPKNPRVLVQALDITSHFLSYELHRELAGNFSAFCSRGGIEVLMKVEKTKWMKHKNVVNLLNRLLEAAVEYVACRSEDDDDLVLIHANLTTHRLAKFFGFE